MSMGAEIQRAATEKVRFVMANRERLLEAWVAETGLLPSESVLVETTSWEGAKVTTTISVRRRTP